MEGSEEQQLDGVLGLDFLAWSHNAYAIKDYHHDLFIQATRDLLPSLRTAVKSNRFEGKVLAAVLALIQHLNLLWDENEQLAQLS